MKIGELKDKAKETIDNLDRRKVIWAVSIIVLLITGFFIYRTYFAPPIDEETEIDERAILDEKIREDREGLQKAREEVRGSDYVPPTAEERDVMIEEQTRTLEDLRQRSR